MAKVFDIMELLVEGIKFATSEHEKIDLINEIADFCSTSGTYFESEEYLNLESLIVGAIDFGNSPDYTLKRFEEHYAKIVNAFMMFKNKYCDEFDRGTVISFAVCAYGNKETLTECLTAMFKYLRIDMEAIVLDCSPEKDLEETVKQLNIPSIRYFKSSTDNQVSNELEALSKCTGMFVFPIYEEDCLRADVLVDFLSMIKNNPQAGTIICPYFGGTRYTENDNLWESIPADDSRLEQAKEIKHKTGFGYRSEYINLKEDGIIALNAPERLESPEELYSLIAKQLCKNHETILFMNPLYALKEKTDN